MEKTPVENFVKPETALEGAGRLEERTASEQLLDLPEDAGRDDVIDAVISRQTSLAAALEEVQARPGFNLDANQMLAKRAEESKAEQDLNELSSTWAELGGDDILAAQQAVDALNFKSTANDRVAATTHLRDAKNAFYENYTASRAEAAAENQAETTDVTSPASEATPKSIADFLAERNAANEARQAELEAMPFVEIKRPAVKKYEAEQAAKAEQATEAAPEHTDVDGKYDTSDTPLRGIDKNADARENWHAMMQAEREAKAAAKMQRNHELGGAAIDLLADSQVVAEYRAGRQKRRERFNRLRESFVKRRLERDLRKTRKQHAKELKAFDRQATKERALQDAEDRANQKSAGREDKIENKLFEKRLKAEAKLKAKQDAKMERFNGREATRLERRKKLGRAATRARLLVTR